MNPDFGSLAEGLSPKNDRYSRSARPGFTSPPGNPSMSQQQQQAAGGFTDPSADMAGATAVHRQYLASQYAQARDPAMRAALLREINAIAPNPDADMSMGKPTSPGAPNPNPGVPQPAQQQPAPQSQAAPGVADFGALADGLSGGRAQVPASATAAPQTASSAPAATNRAQAAISAVGEPVMHGLSKFVGNVVGGVAGVGSAIAHGSLDAGANTVNNVRDAFDSAWQPQTTEGQQAETALGSGAKAASNFLFDPKYGGDKTPLGRLVSLPGQAASAADNVASAGYPGAATALRMLPDVAMMAGPGAVGAIGKLSGLATRHAAGEAVARIASRAEPSVGPRTVPDAPGTPPSAPQPTAGANASPAASTTRGGPAAPMSQSATAAARHAEANSLPVPVGLTEGQATGDIAKISDEINNRAKSPGIAQRLNEQNGQIVQNLDAIRAKVAPDVTAPDSLALGQDHVDAYKAMDAASRAEIGAKYTALRDANGGAFPIDGPTFVKNARAALDDNMKDAFVPSSIGSALDKFADGATPMTFKDFENLRTNLAAEGRKAARGGDGNAESALGTIRDQLEALPMTNETAAIKPLADDARSAAKARFDKINADPAYKAAINDETPMGEPSPLADKFMQQYVVNGKAANVQRMASNLADDPLASQRIAASLVDHVRGQSGLDLRTNAGNVAQSGMNKAIAHINPKLDAALGPEAAGQARTLGNVARYTQEEPRGSYVNNSNTAVVLAKGAAEHATNAAFHGVPVGTVVRKVGSFLGDRAATKRALAPNAGVKLRDLLPDSAP